MLRKEIPGWLEYTETKHGNGHECLSGTVITTNYKGYDQNGKVFDSNEGRQPF